MDKYELIIEKIEDLYEDETITMEEAVNLESLAFDKYVLEADEEDKNEKKKMTAEQRKKILKIVAIATACITISALIIRELKKQKKEHALKTIKELRDQSEKILSECKTMLKKPDLSLSDFDDLLEKTRKISDIYNKMSSIGFKYNINIDRDANHKTCMDLYKKLSSELDKQSDKVNKKILNS